MRAEDFDWFRENYSRMSLPEVREFYVRLHKEHPQQEFYNAKAAVSFLRPLHPSLVMEIGGGSGKLAGEVLRDISTIQTWHNYELCKWAPDTDNRKYKLKILDEFVWNINKYLAYDTLVMSHSMEHISPEQFVFLLGRLPSLKTIYIDYPTMPPGGWKGQTCAHVNPMSQARVFDFVKGLGFSGDIIWHTQNSTAMGFIRDT